MTPPSRSCSSRWRLRARRLLVFAAMGTVLHLVGRTLPPREDARPPVRVEVPAGASPSRIERAIDEAVLVESALELGLPWTDPFVRARLVADMRARDDGLVSVTDEELLRHARELDLVRVHPVVRARVAESMRRRLEHAVMLDPPTDAELDAYMHAHADRYTLPPRIDFRQVFVAQARHGSALESVAGELAARLRDAGIDSAEARSDPTLLPRDHVAATPAAIDAAFGPGVGAAIAAAEPGRWIGPLRGAYGMHVVFVRARRSGAIPDRSTIADRVRADLDADRRRTQLDRNVRALRARVRVTVQVEEGAA